MGDFDYHEGPLLNILVLHISFFQDISNIQDPSLNRQITGNILMVELSWLYFSGTIWAPRNIPPKIEEYKFCYENFTGGEGEAF